MDALKQVHVELTDDLREFASLYTVGALSPEENAVYEAHLSAVCAVCRAEVASLRKVTGAIGLTADPVYPRGQLRDWLMRNISTTPQAPAGREPGIMYDQDGVLIARSR